MAVPLSELQRRFFDRMDEGQSQYITPQQALDCINEAYSLLWGMYTRAEPNFFESEYTVPIVSGVRDYPLPTNMRRVLSVYATPTAPGGAFIPLTRWGRMGYQGVGTQFLTPYYYNSVPMYGVMGQNLRLDPIPTTPISFGIVVWYLPHYTPLANQTDTLDPAIYPGHEQWLINQAVIQLKIGKEEQPADDLIAANTAIASQISEDLKQRDMAQARPVLDADGWDGWIV